MRAPSAIWALATKNRLLEVEEARGKLQIWLPLPHVCVTRVVGHLSADMAQRWIAAIQPHFDAGVVFVTFHDWAEMRSYDSSARVALTEWVVRHFRNIHSARFLVSSRLVLMGVSTANLAAALVGRHLDADSDRMQFEAALGRAL